MLDSTSLQNINSIKDTVYRDRTDLETSLNHIHIDDLKSGWNLINNWEEQIRLNYPGKEFILILSCTHNGEDVIVRFYQYRSNEPQWIDIDNLEGYKEEGILVIQVLNVNQ